MDTWNFGVICKSYQATQSQTACSDLQDLFFREINKAPRCLSLPPCLSFQGTRDRKGTELNSKV